MSKERVFISATHCIVNPLQSGCKMLPMNVECKTRNLFQKKKCFRTLQLHRVVGAVHVSAQCRVPHIYEHGAWSHIHLDSYISAHTCSHQLTSAHHYSSYLPSTFATLIICTKTHSSRNLDSYIPADICSHQLISAHHFSYLLTSSCSNFLISTNIFSHLLGFSTASNYSYSFSSAHFYSFPTTQQSKMVCLHGLAQLVASCKRQATFNVVRLVSPDLIKKDWNAKLMYAHLISSNCLIHSQSSVSCLGPHFLVTKEFFTLSVNMLTDLECRFWKWPNFSSALNTND